MVTGKLFTEPIRPGEGVFSTLLVGNGIWRGLVESWADSGVRKIGNREMRERSRFKIPPGEV